mgnify:CR=1 FL=1
MAKYDADLSALFQALADPTRRAILARLAAGPAAVSDLAGPAQFLLDKAQVALSSGHVFGSGGKGHVRLNYATSQSILTTAIDRMALAVDAMQSTET